MNRPLDTEIGRYVQARPDLRVLAVQETSAMLEEVRQRYVSNPGARWWWDSLKTTSEVMNYGDSDGLAIVEEKLGGHTSARLVVTDDEHPPWIAVGGCVAALVDLLRDHQWFEYFLTDSQASWVVFDRHHNRLITIGSIPARAKET